MASRMIPFSTELRPRLPTIVGNVDYLTLRHQIEQIDQLLPVSGVESDFVERALQKWQERAAHPPSALQQEKFQRRSRRALRCEILKTLLGEDYRGFSCQLAGNALYQWFCLIDAIDQVRVPSKSELQRYSHWLDASQMRGVIDGLLLSGRQRSEALELKEALDPEQYFLDTTCLKANIHYPVDWVLLRDATRTLMKAIKLIRDQGLRGRMEPPEEFMRRMNRLSIAMTHSRRQAESIRTRKSVLRSMKKQVKIVQAHAQRHRDLLEENWAKTEWTRPQAEQVLRRIDGVLKVLPQAQKQAHERIIGGRTLPNEDKILSLYEPDVHVLVRGKAGAEVEFGNKILVGENRQGIILDYQVWKETVPADTDVLVESLERVVLNLDQKVGALGADRGFSSAANSQGLEECGIFNAICPRNPAELKARLKEKKFVEMQRRRSQTEGRISILKNVFWGAPMRAKGFSNRELAVAWGVLTHNLWMFARLRKKKTEPLRAAA